MSDQFKFSLGAIVAHKTDLLSPMMVLEQNLTNCSYGVTRWYLCREKVWRPGETTGYILNHRVYEEELVKFSMADIDSFLKLAGVVCDQVDDQ